MYDERDYSYLEGAPVKVRGLPCVVAHIDFWVGLTISYPPEKAFNVLCFTRPDLHKKLIGDWKRDVDGKDQVIYVKAFEHAVKGIECGNLDDEWFADLQKLHIRSDGISAGGKCRPEDLQKACVFNQ